MPKRGRTSRTKVVIDLLVRQNQEERFAHGHRLGTLVAKERGGPEIFELAHLESVVPGIFPALFGQLHLFQKPQNNPMQHFKGAHRGVDVMAAHFGIMLEHRL